MSDKHTLTCTDPQREKGNYLRVFVVYFSLQLINRPYDASIIPKQSKKITTLTDYRSVFLMHIEMKFINRILGNKT